MTQIRFVCLANSYKEGGRCLAGIELDFLDRPVISNGKPRWVRPVCDTKHGEVPTNNATPYRLLDIIEVSDVTPWPFNYQVENFLFELSSMKKVGVFNPRKLAPCCEAKDFVFKTAFPSLTGEAIQGLDYSLLLVKPEKCEIAERMHEDKKYPQQRMLFSYNGVPYDFSITDPVFLKNYKDNHDIFSPDTECFMCLSVGIKFPPTQKHYKLVAGIISIEKEKPRVENGD